MPKAHPAKEVEAILEDARDGKQTLRCNPGLLETQGAYYALEAVGMEGFEIVDCKKNLNESLLNALMDRCAKVANDAVENIDIAVHTPSFRGAKRYAISVTQHFAEVDLMDPPLKFLMILDSDHVKIVPYTIGS